MQKIKVNLAITIDYLSELTYKGDDIELAEALIDLVITKERVNDENNSL